MSCPNCMQPLSNKNRLVTEDCGHSKCRQCLITEVSGCEKCKQNQTFSREEITITNNSNNNQNNSENDNVAKPRKTTIPTHIVKTHEEDQITYHCTICDKRFKSRTQQYYHLFCNNSSNKPFKCDTCFKSFSTSAHLNYHKAGHSTQSFQCSVCNKTFSKIQILRKHEKLHSTVAEECSECGAKLRNKEALDAHLKRHQNVLPFECNKCDKKFSLRSSLRMHEQIVHIAAKKYKCDVCGKVFNRNSSLKTHSLTHSNQKVLSCSVCSRLFVGRKSLLRHSRIHNVKSRYKCTLCDTSSIRKDNILRHIRNTHPNEDKSCVEEITEEYDEESENGSSDSEELPKQLKEPANDVPKIIPNSSVIRCIGNVRPVTIAKADQVEAKQVVVETISATPALTLTTQKKVKKPYDPHEIYRKILYDDDSSQDDNDTNGNNEGVVPNAAAVTKGDDSEKQFVQESIIICNGQQSNFSETHWRKNFKHNYQIQFD